MVGTDRVTILTLEAGSITGFQHITPSQIDLPENSNIIGIVIDYDTESTDQSVLYKDCHGDLCQIIPITKESSTDFSARYLNTLARVLKDFT